MKHTYTCEQLILHFLTTLNGFGPSTISKIVQYCGGIQNVLNAKEGDFLAAGITRAVASEFFQHKNSWNMEKASQELNALDITLITHDNPHYPFRLKEIHGAPVLLYAKGNIDLLTASHILSVVGSRTMSSYGQLVTNRIVSDLQGSGLTLASGLALGVDAMLHNAAQKSNQPSIAVMASGMSDRCITPQTNLKLFQSLIENGGCAISEYAPHVHAQPHNFPVRNRIISGIAWGVLVVEAKKKSGSLITAYSALDQSRELFAVPGSIYLETSGGCNDLLKQGANLVTSAEDITKLLPTSFSASIAQSNAILFSPEEELLFHTIKTKPMPTDEVIELTKLPHSVVISRLTLLEMKGVVKGMGDGNWYVI